MAEKELDDINNDMNDEELDGEQQLYEHFRLVVDKGQEPERIDKYLFVRMR